MLLNNQQLTINSEKFKTKAMGSCRMSFRALRSLGECKLMSSLENRFWNLQWMFSMILNVFLNTVNTFVQSYAITLHWIRTNWRRERLRLLSYLGGVTLVIIFKWVTQMVTTNGNSVSIRYCFSGCTDTVNQYYAYLHCDLCAYFILHSLYMWQCILHLL